MTTFQSSRTCSAGHLGLRYIANGECVQCSRARADRLRAQERQKLRSRPLIANLRRFDITMMELEKAWGPYAKWTREQHAKHSDVLRKLAGIDEREAA